MKLGHSLSRVLLAAVFGAALALGACSKQDDVASTASPGAAVKSIELGTVADQGTRQITMPGSTFAPGDTIYASVTTAGPGVDGDEVKMDADWIGPAGQVVLHSSHKGVAGASRSDLLSATEPGGFAPGNYRLDIKLNDATAATKEFAVQ